MSAHTPKQVEHDSIVAPDQQKLKAAALLTLATITGILAGYHETTGSMISIWMRSETFAHGFLIFPFSAYLIWGQRKHLSEALCQPSPLALLVLASLGFSWLLATLASVQVFKQFLLIAMIPAAVWAILGRRMVWALAFPLAYLALAVPFGEALIPPLIDFTADFTVKALQLTGIPVYREGSFFSIPSGNWSVVEACSGIRYLIASFTLGTLYAYLTYHSLKRRLIFIALSLIVPIVANGIRAYMIVMTGHLSDMQLAVGVDHLIYGWVFFGFVMLLLFWIGSFWREDDNTYANDSAGPTTEIETGRHANGKIPLKNTVSAAGAVLAVAFIWPLYAGHLERASSPGTEPGIDIPDIQGKWRISSSRTPDWRPKYVGAVTQLSQSYQKDGMSVDLYISYYRNQTQDSELINSQNTLVSEADPGWHNIKQETRSIALGSRHELVNQSQLRSSSTQLLIWRWYWLRGESTANPYLAKFILARNKLLQRGADGAEVIIATRYEDTREEAVPVLQGFLDDMLPAITEALQNADSR
ncbi:exosortase A [Nitrosospira sp. Nsp11]|uniref:exosortase A n=1 Tax=Nitrosospira sp. Nsp11 TaxID=1855338 RepID=UPI0009177F42|nr:exosortase A [Nitrosospira sp. Nsp11]SHL78611.1 exosortase A [Nitrosospira sp. Nsp11]